MKVSIFLSSLILAVAIHVSSGASQMAAQVQVSYETNHENALVIPESTTFDEEFNGPDLNPRWSWVNEDSNRWSLTDRPGYLRIITQRGDLYKDNNNLRNLLVQQVPDEDFTITTLLTINSNTRAQQGGLLVYQDDDNYIHLTRGYMSTGNNVEFNLEQKGNLSTQRVAVADTSVYLAISRRGASYTAYYSLDGTTWTLVGEYSSVDLQLPKVGLSAWNGNLTAPEIPVDFDFFHLMPESTTFDDEFNGPDLNPRWSWVNEDSNHWSLTDRPGYLRIITQRGDLYKDNNNLRNLLVQQVPDEDFTITTLLTINSNTRAQQGGLLVYQDDDNYIHLTRGYMSTGNNVEFNLEQKGNLSTQRVAVADTSVYLAISRRGASYIAYYSLDGTTWTLVGEYSSVDLQQPKVGLSAWNGNLTAPEIPVDFDFFHLISGTSSEQDFFIYFPSILNGISTSEGMVFIPA